MTTIAQITHMATLPPQAARAYLRECSMSLADRERHLYITGRTGEAEQVAEMIETTDGTIVELREERDDLQKTIDRMENEARDFEDAVEAAEEKVLTLTADLENAQDEIKALQVQIREASIDLL